MHREARPDNASDPTVYITHDYLHAGPHRGSDHEWLDDLGTTVGIYAMIDEADSQAIPAELRPLVDRAWHNPLDAALDLLEDVQSGASPDGLDEVVDRLSRLQADDTGVQAAVDANLSLALRCRPSGRVPRRHRRSYPPRPCRRLGHRQR